MSEKLNDKCAVARDLMPLCVDGSASDASRRRVERHVSACDPCAQIYAEMQTPVALDAPEENPDPQFSRAVKKMKGRRQRRMWLSILAGVMIAVLAGAAGLLAANWYFLQPVDCAGEFSLVQTGDRMVYLCVENTPRSASLRLEAVQRADSGEVLYDLYLTMQSTRAAMRSDPLMTYYYPLARFEEDGEPEDGAAVLMLQRYGYYDQPVDRMLQGNPQSGGRLFYEQGQMVTTTASLQGKTLRQSAPVLFIDDSAPWTSGLVTPVVTNTPTPRPVEMGSDMAFILAQPTPPVFADEPGATVPPEAGGVFLPDGLEQNGGATLCPRITPMPTGEAEG